METILRPSGAIPADGRVDPHSLGILIEWKLPQPQPQPSQREQHPHSLGILIEWKLYGTLEIHLHSIEIPTRWGS